MIRAAARRGAIEEVDEDGGNPVHGDQVAALLPGDVEPGWDLPAAVRFQLRVLADLPPVCGHGRVAPVKKGSLEYADGAVYLQGFMYETVVEPRKALLEETSLTGFPWRPTVML